MNITNRAMRGAWHGCAAILLSCWLGAAPAQNAPSDPAAAAAALRERHAALREPLRNNIFGRALHLDSQEASGNLRGDIHAVVDHPFARVAAALGKAESWCDILILHLNVKQCRVQADGPATTLVVNSGRKFDQPIEQTYRIDFKFALHAATADYLHAGMRAESGPMSTRDYRISLQAIALDAGHSFVHLSYAYGYGTAARLAMQAYLATIGSDKVGFTVLERQPDGKPVYVGGVRGVVERNTMRYYLAIDAYLDSLALPPAQQVEKRLKDWFVATERYAQQLHEMNESEYLEMKRKEVARRE